MASSLYFPGKYFFYPIGNTSAVCLTRDVLPELPASILLLPCGDPRNVLYTLFCEESNRLGRSLDFTCCDFDPGVLARNVLLLTMIMDGVAADPRWNIFFHMYLDANSRSTLLSQSRKLASYASIGAWHSSPYGAIIKMGSEHTFAELRRHWELYADFYHPSKLHRLRTLQAMMERKLTKTTDTQDSYSFNITCSRSAGPLFVRLQSNDLVSEQFKHYWKTGSTFTDKRKLAASTYPNSTFFYSRAREGFHVHYGTDPMIPFHHAPLLGNTGQVLAVRDLVESSKSQFHDWCSSFQSAASPRAGKTHRPLIVRFLLGEALAVARAFRDFSESDVGVRAHPFVAPKVAPWTSCIMELDREEYSDFGAPTRFDVVDTSNLSDHIGMLNMLLATVPLLTDSPTSVLYTESLLTHISDPRTEFESKLFAGLSGVAILMDLAPVDVLSGFTTRCNTHEVLATSMLSGSRQRHQIIAWRRPGGGDPSKHAYLSSHPPMSFDTLQLSKLLHSIYVHLYKTEDPTYLLKVGRGDLMGTLRQSSYTCDPREAIVVLFDFIRTRLQIPMEQWSDIMRTFLDIRSQDIATTRFFDHLGNSDIHAQLYRYGLFTVPGLEQVCKPTTGRFSHWKSIPPLIRIFLAVPRIAISKLEDVSDDIPTPWLRCVIGTAQGEHVFQSVDAAFGRLIDVGTAAEPALSFHEEPDGQKEGSDLVFSFVVPSLVLVEAPPSAISIALTVRADPMSVQALTRVLGLALCVLKTSLQDTEHVHLLPEQPLRRSSRPHVAGTTTPQRPESEGRNTIGHQEPIRVDLDGVGKRVASLTVKLNITNITAQAAFAGGAMPDISQCSPCTIQVVLDGQTQVLAYPMPIVGGQRKVRLARKSSYIEVMVPVAIPFTEPDGFRLSPFPVIRTNTFLSPWNIHRVFLDRLPVLNLSKANIPQLQEWYNPHVGSQVCVRERASIKDPARSDLLANIKETIHCIMMRTAGTQGAKGPARAFALRDGPTEDCDTIIFVDKVRFDLSAHAIVCDAFVLPLSDAIMPRIQHALEQLLSRGLENVKLYGQEMRGWKRLLPALVERCRATWMHGANCEYAARGRIPLELEISKGDPLCSCGRGKDTEGMMKDGVWRRFAPFVTRIALSPLFAVSYLEPIFEAGLFEEKARSLMPDSPRGSLETAPTAMCAKCRKKESADVKMRRCSRCRTTYYCSEACQKGDWKTHKSQCKK